MGYKIDARTVSLKEGGPQGGPAEAGGGGRRRQPQVRRLSPNLHRFGRGSSVERNENDFFFFLSFFFSCLVIRSIPRGSSCGEEKRWDFFLAQEAMGMESDLGSGRMIPALRVAWARGPWRRNSGNL